MPSSSPEDQQRLRERLGERRVRRHHQRLTAALERQPAARIEHVAVAAASDQRRLAEASRDRERLVREREHAERSLVGTAREQPPARGARAARPAPRRCSARSRAARVRFRARAAAAASGRAPSPSRCRRGRRRRPRCASATRAAIDPDLIGADQRPRSRDLAGARRHARLSGARPERDQRPHRHVERPLREARVRDRRREDPRQLGIHRDRRRAPPRGSASRDRWPGRSARATRRGAPRRANSSASVARARGASRA